MKRRDPVFTSPNDDDRIESKPVVIPQFFVGVILGGDANVGMAKRTRRGKIPKLL